MSVKWSTAEYRKKIVQSHAGGKMAITFINLYHFLVISRPVTDLTAVFKYHAGEVATQSNITLCLYDWRSY